MMIVACSAKNLTTGGYQEAVEGLKHFFVDGKGRNCGVTSLYVQARLVTFHDHQAPDSEKFVDVCILYFVK